MRRPFTYWAFPEIFLPSIIRSLRPESSAFAPMLCSTFTTGSVNLRKLWKFSAENGAMKEKLRFPRS